MDGAVAAAEKAVTNGGTEVVDEEIVRAATKRLALLVGVKIGIAVAVVLVARAARKAAETAE